MARLYLLVCDFCKREKSSPRDTNKLPGWTELHLKSRPLEEGTDAVRDHLICDQCSAKLYTAIRKIYAEY